LLRYLPSGCSLAAAMAPLRRLSSVVVVAATCALAVVASVGASEEAATVGRLSSLRSSDARGKPRRLQAADGATGDSEEGEIEQLRKRLQEERNRAEIADVASVAAIKNATAQAQRRRQAEDELAKASPSLQEADNQVRQAKQRTESLETQLRTAKEEAAEAKTEAAAAAAASKGAGSQGVAPQAAPPSFFDGLRAFPAQTLLAVLALAFGLLSILDPPGFLQVSVVLITAVLAGAAAWGEVFRHWGTDAPQWMALSMFLEAAVVVGFAAVVGFEGLLPLVGAGVGAAIAGQLSSLVLGGEIEDSGQWAVWYGAWCTAGVAGMLLGGIYSRAVAGPVIGGIFVASCASFCAASLGGESWSWWDCMFSLMFPTSAAVSGVVHVLAFFCWLAIAGAGVARFFMLGDGVAGAAAGRYPFADVLVLLGLPDRPPVPPPVPTPSTPPPPKQSTALSEPLLLETRSVAASSRGPGVSAGGQRSSPTSESSSSRHQKLARKSQSSALLRLLSSLLTGCKRAMFDNKPKMPVRR